MSKSKKLLIVGDGDFAQIAYQYFMKDSIYEISGFAVEREFRKHDELFGLPVVDFEEIPFSFKPQEYEIFVAITFNQFNRVRTRLYEQSKSLGYKAANYISSRSFVWDKDKIGEHVFIFENNVIQPFVEIGNNVILWSGNHVGHHSIIKDNCFISSHVVISGNCEISENCFLGVNSTIANNVKIARDNWIGPACLLTKNTEENKIYTKENSQPSSVGAKKFFKVRE